MSDGRPGPRATATALRPALVVVAGSAVLLCVVELAWLRTIYPELVWIAGLLALAGVGYVFAGAIAWDRRPSNRLGLWLVVLGFLILVARLSLVADPVLATVGLFVAQAPLAGVVVAMLLFPSGRFEGALDRGLAIAAFACVVGFAIPSGLYRAEDGTRAWRLGDDPALVAQMFVAQRTVFWALLVVVVVVLIRRLRHQRAVRGERRARAVVYVTGLVAVVALPLVPQLGFAYGWNELFVFAIQVGLVAVVPVVFVGSLLLGGFGRTGRLDELATWLGSAAADRRAVRDALARTLGDDSLQLLFRRRDSPALVDESGRAAADPQARPPTGVVELELQGESTAVIAYDTAAVPDPETVRAAGRVVAVALDRDRATAELLAERAELRRSRTRLVEVGDLERRRLARDLHDGLQGRLVLAAIRAGTLAAGPTLSESDRGAAANLRIDLERSVDELRGLVHGVLPALLLERGLLPAARELVERCGIPTDLRLPAEEPPWPPAVASSAYFVLAEAVTNAVKHAHASRLRVVVAAEPAPDRLRLEVDDDGIGGADTGPGLQGMADRVEALGGSFRLSSPLGQGCSVVAVIPYAAEDPG